MRRTATSEVTNICSQGIESNEKEGGRGSEGGGGGERDRGANEKREHAREGTEGGGN